MPSGYRKDGTKIIPPSRKGVKLTTKQKEHLRIVFSGEKNPFYGKTHTTETLEKIKKTHQGNKYRLGHKASEETRKKLSESHKTERPWRWKNEKISDKSLKERYHKWIVSLKGKPRKCEHCGTTEAKFFDWSNKNHQYNKIEDEWQRLCRKCHIRYDIKNNNLLNKYK